MLKENRNKSDGVEMQNRQPSHFFVATVLKRLAFILHCPGMVCCCECSEQKQWKAGKRASDNAKCVEERVIRYQEE